jgi:hypothetical protein
MGIELSLGTDRNQIIQELRDLSTYQVLFQAHPMDLTCKDLQIQIQI